MAHTRKFCVCAINPLLPFIIHLWLYNLKFIGMMYPYYKVLLRKQDDK